MMMAMVDDDENGDFCVWWCRCVQIDENEAHEVEHTTTTESLA